MREGEIEYWSFSKRWMNEDRAHRTIGPSYVDENGYRVWCLEGFYQRVGSPNSIFSNGCKSMSGDKMQLSL